MVNHKNRAVFIGFVNRFRNRTFVKEFYELNYKKHTM
jgi:hypothetical protein